MPTTVETVRDALVKARRERSLAEIASLPVPATLAEGLLAQAAVGKAIGLPEAGWKVGIAEDGTAVEVVVLEARARGALPVEVAHAGAQ